MDGADVSDYPMPALLENPGDIVESLDHNRWTWYEWACPLGWKCTAGPPSHFKTNKSWEAGRWRAEHIHRHAEQVEYLRRREEERAMYADLIAHWEAKGCTVSVDDGAFRISYHRSPSKLSLWFKRVFTKAPSA